MNNPLIRIDSNKATSFSGSSVLQQGARVLQTAARYIPTPASQFGDILQSITNVGQAALGGDPLSGGTAELGELLQTQMETQLKMQTVSMASNIEKSSHESKMAAIRNVRVG